jgi:hypothetical protein
MAKEQPPIFSEERYQKEVLQRERKKLEALERRKQE